MRRNIGIFLTVGIFLLFILSGCSQPGPLNSADAIGLMTKCRDFLSFCLMVLNQPDANGNVLYNQVISRYYYSLFFLGKVAMDRHQYSPKEQRLGSHEKVWRRNGQNVQSYYGQQLKELRRKCDYGCSNTDLNPNSYQCDFKNIASNDLPFNELLNQVDSKWNNMPHTNSEMISFNDLKQEIVDKRNDIIASL